MCNDTNRIGHKTHRHKQKKHFIGNIQQACQALQQIYALFAVKTYFIAQNVLKYFHGRLILCQLSSIV